MQLQSDPGKQQFKERATTHACIPMTRLSILFSDSSSFSRGFGFITFKDANIVEKVLGKDVHTLDEKQVRRDQTSV